MRRQRFILVLLMSSLLFVACQQTNSSPTPALVTPTPPPVTLGPRIIHHPRPDIPAMNLAPFEQAAVFENQPDLFYTNGFTGDSPFARLDCREISRPSDPLGALTPAYPLATCLNRERGLYSSGCMMPLYTSYVTYRDDRFEVIASLEDFKALFAPIDSAPEALSYALATTGLNAVYGIRLTPGQRALTDTLEDTHVTEVADGYQINLYESGHCGCGPNALRMINVLVTTAGEVETLDQVRVSEDASGNIVCVD